MDSGILNTIWLLVCAALVFSMQAGFLCRESGLTRSKNAINVAMKYLTDFAVSLLLFWAFGFALMYGAAHKGTPSTPLIHGRRDARLPKALKSNKLHLRC